MKKIGNVTMDPSVMVYAEFYPETEYEAKLAKVLIEMCDEFRYVNLGGVKFVIEGHTFGYIAEIADKAKYRRLKFNSLVKPVVSQQEMQ